MLLLEESQPIASGDCWTMTVDVNQIEQTPKGSRHVRQSASYNFKEGADNEGAAPLRGAPGCVSLVLCVST